MTGEEYAHALRFYMQPYSLIMQANVDAINKTFRDWGAIEVTGREVVPVKELNP